MKKILYSIIAVLGIFGTTSCSDVLESDSSRQLFEPSLSEKTDSVFYAYGIMQAMQQLADQYFFQNEMRGDLVTTTNKATTNLKNLASFTADVSNKYDSVYLYYKVINNCNYYLAHRDTTLTTGARNVVCNEYAAVASFRAWAYLQLTRQYGNVPYVTEPVTTIDQINSNTAPASYAAILAGEAENLEKLKARYSDEQIAVPTFNNALRSIGRLNWDTSVEKQMLPGKCFIPLNVVLGDLYLELGEYEKAAKCYYQYLRYDGEHDPYYASIRGISVNFCNAIRTSYSWYSPIFKNLTDLPADFNETQQGSLYANQPVWENSFQHSAAAGDVISYIPMAVNYTQGKTTDIPAIFGYSYYGTDKNGDVRTSNPYSIFNCPKTENIQVVPSKAYCDSARLAQHYYYTVQSTTGKQYWTIKSAPLGDARARIVSQGDGEDSSYVYCDKPSTAYILLYRNATVWLHLAEALNRMGYPDAAFAVLKNGIHSELANFRYYIEYVKDSQGNDSIDEQGNKIIDVEKSHMDENYYLTPESYELLTTTLPFLSQENSEIFRNGVTKAFVGIHAHGAGAVDYINSSYRYSSVLKSKIDDIYAKFNLGTPSYTKEDFINAMEDLLCDEYAMEFAFEGTRFSDLRRLALHKNMAGTYSGNFGDIWLSRMLQNNAPGITTQNCYLPFQ
ncbi:MAG: RagB/SusD family nutrient uptake outer membrane protein [Prevotella sp.]|nr:RagB/SusD family nutrient uptake outer membrane protein [Prevotella sp.]